MHDYGPRGVARSSIYIPQSQSAIAVAIASMITKIGWQLYIYSIIFVLQAITIISHAMSSRK